MSVFFIFHMKEIFCGLHLEKNEKISLAAAILTQLSKFFFSKILSQHFTYHSKI